MAICICHRFFSLGRDFFPLRMLDAPKGQDYKSPFEKRFVIEFMKQST